MKSIFLFFSFYCSVGFAMSNQCHSIFTPGRALFSYSKSLQNVFVEMKVFEIPRGEVKAIAILGQGSQAEVRLMARRLGNGEVRIFVRKIYDRENDARRDANLFSRFLSLKSRDHLSELKVPRVYGRYGRQLDLDYIEGLPLTEFRRPDLFPFHERVYLRYYKMFHELWRDWRNLFQHLEVKPPVHNEVLKLNNLANIQSLPPREANVGGSLTVLRRSRGDLVPQFNIKPENIVVENRTMDFYIIDPM